MDFVICRGLTSVKTRDNKTMTQYFYRNCLQTVFLLLIPINSSTSKKKGLLQLSAVVELQCTKSTSI